MTISSISIYACAFMLITTATIHSVLGEIRLISPLLRQRDGILEHDLARFLLRAVWHFMSVSFAIIAAGLIASVGGDAPVRRTLLAATAVGIGGGGVYDAIGSRGRHIGWPMLVLIGVTALIGFLYDQ